MDVLLCLLPGDMLLLGVVLVSLDAKIPPLDTVSFSGVCLS